MNPVEQLRLASGLSQRAFARLAATSQPTIAAYESGAKSPTWRTIERFASALGEEAVVVFVPPLTREDRRSLVLHRMIARRVLAEPEMVVRRARRNVRRMRAANPEAAPLLREWARILARSPTEIAEVLLDPRPLARALRQVTPFAGLLSAGERAAVYQAFRSDNAHAA